MSIDEILLFLNVGILFLGVLAFSSAYWLYSSRQQVKDRIIQEMNLYVQSQIESLRTNPQAMVNLLKPVIPLLLAELTKSVNSGKTEVSQTGEIANLDGNALTGLGLSLLPKKYQIFAPLIMSLLQNRGVSSPKKDNSNTKSPFE